MDAEVTVTSEAIEAVWRPTMASEATITAVRGNIERGAHFVPSHFNRSSLYTEIIKIPLIQGRTKPR